MQAEAPNYALNLIDGHRTLPVLLEDLGAARSQIHLSIFLFFNDPIGQAVEQVLRERSQAGVRVRVLLNVEKTHIGDPFSTGEHEMMKEDPSFPQDAMDIKALVARLTAAGAEVHDTNIKFGAPCKTRDARLLEQHRLVHKTSRMDTFHIDHRKLVIIDRKVGYCGSANIGAQYLYRFPFDAAVDAHHEADQRRAAGLPEPWWKWHDGLVRFEGPVVGGLEGYFRDRWILDGGEEYPLHDEPPLPSPSPRGIALDRVTLRANQPDSTPNHVRQLFVDEIGAARRSIFIENPYVYHPQVIEALLQAQRAHPGMRVDLIVPALIWNDSEFSQDAMQHYYRHLLDAGVRVHEYQNHFTHLKLATFDDRLSIVGSANLNFRSLENDNDFELVARVESEAFARQINAEVRDIDIPRSKQMVRRKLGFRIRHRDPRTFLLCWRKVL